MTKLRALSLQIVSLLLLGLIWAQPSLAFNIQEVTSPGGIKAWLVEDKNVPLIAMKFAFHGGSSLDPAGKEGAANFLTGMMDEGAADLDSAAFQKLRDELSFKMSFDADNDNFEGTFQTLSKNSERSFDLLRKAITSPRFDAEPVERVRRQFQLGLKDNLEDPERIASTAWMNLAVPGDPYARDPNGTEASLAAITAADLRDIHSRIFNRSTLQVAVVGDISKADLAELLDHVFGGLPKGAEPAPLPPAKLSPGPALKIIQRDIPQSIIVFGGNGILRSDPDFIPAYIMSEILAGGSFGSRLTSEIREKRGLTYGVSASLAPMDRIGFFVGSMGTRNDKAAEALTVIREELNRMAKEGPTEQELQEAKTYLTGSYALRFSSDVAIASQLLAIQEANLGIDYVETRNARVNAVTLEQVKAQARRLLNGDNLIVTVVGKPEGIAIN